MGAISIKLLSRTAKERRPGYMGFAETMVIEYNGRKKDASRLSIQKLYEKEKKQPIDVVTDENYFEGQMTIQEE